ncbi:hypothetical protein HP532_07805 [Pseudomonas sp. CrR25]|nr:hypothetical protein [Pseudomonas sp. CrR25]
MTRAVPVAVSRYAVGGVAGVVLLNLLLRSFVKLGGLLSTLLVAAAVAAAMALWFALSTRRAPLPRERRRLLWLYAGLLGLLYLGLLAMMALQDTPSPMGVLVLGLHYLCYPLLARLCFSSRVFARLQ